ncbi:MFS transporter [Breoghania sp.]|uniref:MFS transporter n=1 Tax=Breoghania sp. TaxID=2065378 RepID=UPI00262693D2|nr:MFS transporter [Breoghania sp.]MDJ0931279.1 MFS transporter [Breoghania sp.]
MSILAGSLFRIGIGAIPFLLPLMLQQSYGKSALSSGLITFSSTAGAMAMKFVAPRVLARVGFRKTLTWNAALAGISIAVIALFDEATPVLIMLAILFIGGFFRSLQFTAINAIGFADLDEKQMSQATGFSAMVQQLSLAIGVSIAALTLQFLPVLRGEVSAGDSDYSIAFIIVGVLVTASVFARLETNADDSVSGHAATVGGANHPPSDPRN